MEHEEPLRTYGGVALFPHTMLLCECNCKASTRTTHSELSVCRVNCSFKPNTITFGILLFFPKKLHQKHSLTFTWVQWWWWWWRRRGGTSGCRAFWKMKPVKFLKSKSSRPALTFPSWSNQSPGTTLHSASVCKRVLYLAVTRLLGELRGAPQVSRDLACFAP